MKKSETKRLQETGDGTSAYLRSRIYHGRKIKGENGAMTLPSNYTTDSTDVEKAVQELLDDVSQSQNVVVEKRKVQRLRRAAARTQNFAAAVSDFLEVFSGIGEIVKSINTPVGGSAYGVLLSIVTCGKSKQVYEDLATEALRIIRKWLTRIQLVIGSHSDVGGLDKDLRAICLDIYNQIVKILLFIEGFYTRSSPSRFFEALLKPPQVHLQPLFDSFKETVADFMHEHAAIQGRKIGQLCKTNRAILDQQSMHHHNEQLRKLSRLLGLDEDGNCQQMITQCRQAYANKFSDTRVIFEDSSKKVLLQQASLDLLDTKKSCQMWQKSITSSVLFLSGDNFKLYDAANKSCWLSTIALDFFDAMCQSHEQVIFISSYFLNLKLCSDVSLEAMLLRSVLQQLLWQNSDLCEKLFGKIVEQVSAAAFREEPAEGVFEVLQMALRQLPSASSLYLVVDGIVFASGTQPYDLAQSLIQLVCDRELKARVKVLGVTKSSHWAEDEARCLVSNKTSKALGRLFHLGKGQCEKLFCELAWKQGKRRN